MNPAAVTYCERWDAVARRADRELTVEQARARYPDGPAFTVVLPRADGGVDVTLEIEQGVTTVTALFVDEDTDEVFSSYTFRRRRDELLFTGGVEYTAPADGRRGLTAVERVRQLRIRADDGACVAAVDTRAGEVGWGESRLDPDALRLPVPAFGDWDELARFDL